MSDLDFLDDQFDGGGYIGGSNVRRRHTPSAPTPIVGASGLTPTERRAHDRSKNRPRATDPGDDWKQDGACRTSTLDFFPDRNEDTSRQKMLCSTCPVRETCLEYALVRNEHGIWGGTSERERERIRRNRRRRVAA